MIKELTLIRVKQTLRSKEFYIYVMAFPLFFLILFGFLWGNSAPVYKTITVGLINKDIGTLDPFTSQDLNISEAFIDTLAEKNSSNGVKLFNLIPYSDEKELTEDINLLKISGGIIIPENFSENAANITRAYAASLLIQLLSQQYEQHPEEAQKITLAINSLIPYFNAKANLTIYFQGDITLQLTMTAYSACWEVLAKFLQDYTITYAETMWDAIKTQYALSFDLDIQSASKKQSSVSYNILLIGSSGEVIKQYSREFFSRLLPGQILQAILLSSTNAMWLIEIENKSGLLKRMKITKLKSWQYIGSLLLSWSIIALLQGTFMLILSAILGFIRVSLSPLAWIMMLVTMILGGIMTATIAMLFVSFTNARVGTPILIFLVSTTVMIVAEYFFQPSALFSFGGKVFTVLDLIPFRAPFLVMKNCYLMQSFNFSTIALDLLLTILWTAAIFTIGTVLFNKFKFQYAEKE